MKIKRLKLMSAFFMFTVVIFVSFVVVSATQQKQEFYEPQIEGTVPQVNLSSLGNIVYFAPETTDNPFVSGERLSEDGVTIVNDWETFTQQASQGVSAVILHHDLNHSIDPAFIRQLYNASVVIVGFDFSGPDMAALVDNPCVYSPGFADDVTERIFVIVARSFSADNQEDLDRYLQNHNQTCGESTLNNINGQLRYSSRRTSDFVATQLGYDFFKFRLFGIVQEYSNDS